MFCSFFFQAEDGIRDLYVTGVQTCALPIFPGLAFAAPPGSTAKTYRISKTYTTLSFTATKWMVFKEEGMFQDFTGSLTYDPADPSACEIGRASCRERG